MTQLFSTGAAIPVTSRPAHNLRSAIRPPHRLLKANAVFKAMKTNGAVINQNSQCDHLDKSKLEQGLHQAKLGRFIQYSLRMAKRRRIPTRWEMDARLSSSGSG